jgi:hypothetical protein
MEKYFITKDQLKSIQYALVLAQYFVDDTKYSDSNETDQETLEAGLLAFDTVYDNQLIKGI